MEVVIANDEAGVRLFLQKFGGHCLFRGQTDFYTHENGEVSVPTTFERKGCVPPLMIKWSHYAQEALRVFRGGHDHDLSLSLSQALLQHYGWRSFFIDLTKSPEVACWFASHAFSSPHQI